MSSEREARDRGALFMVSAPSGAGKTTLVKALTERDANVTISVSHTTRPRRMGERDGVDYHFVDVPHFQGLIEADAFLEHAQVFGHLYGTSREGVRRELDAGRDVVLEIDWQGARQIRNRVPDALGIFVVPPSRDSLRERLEARGQDSPGVIAQRMRNVVADLSHFDEFDYLIVNDAIERAADDLASIVRARRLSRARQVRSHCRLIDDLIGAPRP